MAYGIDELIEQKKDAYRGNPAALQQRGKMSRELIDMLALQQITSEKDAAARNLQMQMEQQPGTIAAQLEQKAVGQTKDEMLKGVSGVMQNNQARQQQNMQRVASAGVAAQPRQNMQQMAQGGIVGYAPGGGVSPQEKFDEIEAVRKQIADGTISKAEGYKKIQELSPGLSSAFRTRPLESDSTEFVQPQINRQGMTARELVDALDQQKQNQQSMDAVIGNMKGNALGTGAMDDGTQGRSPPVPVSAQEVLGMEDEYYEDPQPKVEPKVDPAAKGLAGLNATLAANQVSSDDLGVPKYGYLDPDDYKVKMSDAGTSADLLAGIKAQRDIDPVAERTTQMGVGEAAIGMTPERVAAEQARQQALKAYDASSMDPKKLQSLQDNAFLRGMAKSGTLAGGSANVDNLAAQQDLAGRNRLINRQFGERSFEDEEQRIKEGIYKDAQDVYKAALTRQDAGLVALGKYNDAELKTVTDTQKNLLTADTANLTIEESRRADRLKILTTNANNNSRVAIVQYEQESSNRRTAVTAAVNRAKNNAGSLDDTNKAITSAMKEIAATKAKLRELAVEEIKTNSLDGDSSDAQKIREHYDSMILLDTAGLEKQLEELQIQRDAISRGDGYGNAIPAV